VLLDGPALGDFLARHRESILSKEVVESQEELARLGITIRKSRDTNRKILAAFLLRSHLFRAEIDGSLVPDLIKGNWNDYCRAWKIRTKHGELHLPLRGRIAFLSTQQGRRWVCHPESSSLVEKVFIDPGELAFSHDVGRYKGNAFRKLIRSHFPDKPVLLAREKEFQSIFKTLVGLNLAKKEHEGYLLSGEGLLFTEMQNIPGELDLEKAARIILRRDEERFHQIAVVLAWLECMDRKKELHVVGQSAKSEERNDRKKGQKNDPEEAQFRAVINSCSINTTVATNVMREFSQFGAMIEYYPREMLDRRTMTWKSETYGFLNCHVDSLGLLSVLDSESTPMDEIFKSEPKRERSRRHLEHLLRFISKDQVSRFSSPSDLRKMLPSSEIIDFNPDPQVLKKQADVPVDSCLSNVFVVSRVPVKGEVFKEKTIKCLREESTFRDPQGAFYYPDFRFLLSARLGIPLTMFDHVMAHLLGQDKDFKSRIQFFVEFGAPQRRKHQTDESLKSEVREPFDTIALRY